MNLTLELKCTHPHCLDNKETYSFLQFQEHFSLQHQKATHIFCKKCKPKRNFGTEAGVIRHLIDVHNFKEGISIDQIKLNNMIIDVECFGEAYDFLEEAITLAIHKWARDSAYKRQLEHMRKINTNPSSAPIRLGAKRSAAEETSTPVKVIPSTSAENPYQEEGTSVGSRSQSSLEPVGQEEKATENPYQEEENSVRFSSRSSSEEPTVEPSYDYQKFTLGARAEGDGFDYMYNHVPFDWYQKVIHFLQKFGYSVLHPHIDMPYFCYRQQTQVQQRAFLEAQQKEYEHQLLLKSICERAQCLHKRAEKIKRQPTLPIPSMMLTPQTSSPGTSQIGQILSAIPVKIRKFQETINSLRAQQQEEDDEAGESQESSESHSYNGSTTPEALDLSMSSVRDSTSVELIECSADFDLVDKA